MLEQLETIIRQSVLGDIVTMLAVAFVLALIFCAIKITFNLLLQNTLVHRGKDDN